MRRWAVRGLWGILLVYLGLMAVLYSLQTELIFPGARSRGRAEAVVTPPPGAELVTLSTAGGNRVVALFGPALTADGRPHPDAAHRPSLIYFYGNGMCLNDARFEFDRLRQLGANVLLPEYVGYGMSDGQPSEAGCYATADAALEYLERRPDVDRGKVVLAGWSLGGAVAIDLASRRQVSGLAIFSAFTSMTDMARVHYPFLPISLLLRHRFESEAKLTSITCPIFIGHGQDDAVIPFAMSDRLAAASKGPVTRLNIAGADHNDFFAVGAGIIYPALGQFLELLSH